MVCIGGLIIAGLARLLSNQASRGILSQIRSYPPGYRRSSSSRPWNANDMSSGMSFETKNPRAVGGIHGTGMTLNAGHIPALFI